MIRKVAIGLGVLGLLGAIGFAVWRNKNIIRERFTTEVKH